MKGSHHKHPRRRSATHPERGDWSAPTHPPLATRHTHTHTHTHPHSYVKLVEKPPSWLTPPGVVGRAHPAQPPTFHVPRGVEARPVGAPSPRPASLLPSTSSSGGSPSREAAGPHCPHSPFHRHSPSLSSPAHSTN